MVEIVLSTYNGEKYLREQIESIIAQDYDDWKLIIRDDLSTDKSRDIIEEYEKKYPEKIRQYKDNYGNIGVIKSFERLLQETRESYVMLCDQDDVWKKEKISHTLKKMQEAEKRYGIREAILIFSDMDVTESNLALTGKSFWKQNKIKVGVGMQFHYLCVANCVAGCTIMLNRSALSESLPFPSFIPMHDWWLAARTAQKGHIEYIEEKTVLYRQHGDNVCGSHEVPKGHYIRRVLHAAETIREFNKLRPFLKEVGFGGMVKFWYYKLLYFIIRRV